MLFRSTDIEIHAREMLSLKRRMAEILAHHSTQPIEQVEQDIDRDRFMTPDDAKNYGLIDEIITSRTIAEKSSPLLPGEPARLVGAQEEATQESPEAQG